MVSRITRRALQLRRDESGLSLAEMIVAVLLLSGVLFGVATILQNTVRGYGFVDGETSASTQAQTAARTFTAGVRNAAHLQVAASGTVVRTQHASSGECMSWRFADGNLYGRAGGGGEILLARGAQGSFENADSEGIASFPGVTLSLRVDTNRTDPVDITTTAFPDTRARRATHAGAAERPHPTAASRRQRLQPRPRDRHHRHHLSARADLPRPHLQLREHHQCHTSLRPIVLRR
ncbi:hypothetical protein [Nesterenkonia pannonica]|uniref:hypothetical protein n=1 Tax=Nesterenkonia pannonica TaxID=1548602 RepID=UPI002164C319|nr:hypothetical protein [Nesterenkonia pannonica]